MWIDLKGYVCVQLTLLSISFKLVYLMQTYVVENDFANGILQFVDCYVEDLRNIREYNPDPIKVIVNHCFLQELPNALFIRFPDLKILEICDSRINNLQDYALNGLKGLEVINFSKNNLTAIKPWSDLELENVHTLDLRRNLIKDIDKHSFKRYPNLSRLNLAVNFIEFIPESTFKSVANLKYLNLGRNLLIKIEEFMFKGLTKLTHLSLHHNAIVSIDFFAFVGISHLKYLHLQENKIQFFEADLLSNLHRLLYFNISHNCIEELSENTFKKNSDLKVLDISFNKFEFFHQDTFKGLENLETFNASNNQLETVNKYILKDFISLKFLDLSANKITEIDENLFEYTPRISRLNISSNTINQIGENAFSELTKLRKLDLSNNQISNDGFMWSIVELDFLNLSYNLFRTFNVSILKGISDVKLFGNPWNCKFLLIELMNFPTNIHFGTNYVVESHAEILKVPGIECKDDNEIKRSIIILEHNLKEEFSSFNEEKNGLRERVISRYDEFDTKSILLLLTIGIVVVFVSLKAIKCFTKESEKQSEIWRISKQPNVDDGFAAKTFDIERELETETDLNDKLRL